MDSAESIVRALADASSTDYSDEDDTYHWCHFCRADFPTKIEDHAEDCVWRRASAWVALTPLDD